MSVANPIQNVIFADLSIFGNVPWCLLKACHKKSFFMYTEGGLEVIRNSISRFLDKFTEIRQLSSSVLKDRQSPMSHLPMHESRLHGFQQIPKPQRIQQRKIPDYVTRINKNIELSQLVTCFTHAQNKKEKVSSANSYNTRKSSFVTKIQYENGQREGN